MDGENVLMSGQIGMMPALVAMRLTNGLFGIVFSYNITM